MKKIVLNIIETCEPELRFKTSRSSGSGGQHVNKVETKVTLRWNILDSSSLTSEQKEKILSKLSAYINKEGELVIHSESERSQLKNKQKCISKWKTLLQKAFKVRKARKPTKKSKAVKQRIRKEKENRSKVKATRKKPKMED